MARMPEARVESNAGAGAGAARVLARQERWALVATTLGFAVVQLDVSVVNVGVRAIGADLGGSVTDLQWVVSAYTIAFAAFIVTAGALGDRLGARRLFVAGFVVFTLASIGCGAAPTLGTLIAARAIQGIGAAILVPCSLSVLNHAYPDKRLRARAVGFWSAGSAVALSCGPLVGGLLIAWLDWRAIFFVNVPLGLFAIWLTLRYAQETTRSPDRGLDLPGQAVAVVTLGALAAATIEGGQRGFSSVGVLAGFAVAAVGIGSFLVVESRQRQPLLPLQFFRVPSFSAAAAIGLCTNVAFYGLIFVLSLFFQETQGRSPLETGLAFLPITVAVVAANVVSGHFSGRSGERPVLTAGAILVGLACLGLLVVRADIGYVALAGQLALLGLGVGLIVPAMTESMLASVDESRAGVASGALNTARQTGSVVGVALFGSLATAGSSLLHGLRVGLVISVVLAVAIAVIAQRIRPLETHR